MRQFSFLIVFFLGILISRIQAQIPMPKSEQLTWMNPAQSYYRFDITIDGVYRISYRTLSTLGFPVDQISAEQVVLYTNGQPIRIFLSHEDLSAENGYILFYAEKNRGDVDQLIYEDAATEQLNPNYSLYRDERAYYLSWSTTETSPRFETIDNGLNNLGGVPVKEEYYIHHEAIRFHDYHVKPTHNGRDFIRFSNLDITEGFGSTPANDEEYLIPVDHISEFGIDPKIELRFGTNVVSRNWQVSVNDWVIANLSKNSYDIAQLDQKFPRELLSNGQAKLRIKSLSDKREKHSLAYAILKYPRKYDFQNKSIFTFHQQPSIVSRLLQISNFNGSRPLLLNITKGWMITPETALGTLRLVSPAGFEDWKWVAVDMNKGVTEVKNFALVRKPAMVTGNYWILTGAKLAGSEAVKSYAEYRRSAPGGGYDVSIISVDDLYDDFAYGVKGHPLAIRKYIAEAKSVDQLPDYIFIIGKGREYAEQRFGHGDASIVPTFGIPGSDQLLISPSFSQQHDISVGRLSASNSQEVSDYLQKIVALEDMSAVNQSLEDLEWRKKVLHLSGGSSDIQNLIYGYLNNMGEVISKNKYGGDVETFRKTSSDPIQKSRTEEIVKSINNGVSLLAFFGHSAVGTFDFSLEDPSKYDNQGKNPVILSLGCHSGNIYTPTPGISEEFVLQAERGAIAFIASSGTAYIEPQYQLGRRIYNLLGSEDYGQTIGEVVRSALQETSTTTDISVATLRQQLTLHGDPAYRLVNFQGPDFTVDNATIVVQPDVIDQSTQSLHLNFDVVNLGASIDQDIDVQIIHRLQDGTAIDTIILTIPAPNFREPLELSIPKPERDIAGLNTITITVDPANQIKEMPNDEAELNNELIMDDGTVGYSFYVYDNGAKPVYPPDFGIVNDSNLILQASISNTLAPGGVFILQIDTTDLFDSPFLMSEEVYSSTSNVEWAPSINWEEGQVYYWRIAPVSQDFLKNYQWKQRSFVFMAEHSYGWNQSHYYQWLKDDYYKMVLDTNRRFDFDGRIWDIRIKNELREIQDFWVFVNNTAWASLNPKELAPGMNIFIWHPESFIFRNNGTDYGSLRYSPDAFVYHLDKRADRANVKRLLDAAPDGSRVFIHTILADEDSDLLTREWSKDKTILGYDLYDVLESHGARKVRGLQLRGTVPYTFIFDKGIGPVVEDIANNIYETIDLSSKARGKWEDGYISSTYVDGGKQFLRLEWSEIRENTDSTWIEIRGIKSNGVFDVLKQIKGQYSVDLTDINTASYPQVQLVYRSKDVQRKSSAQLNYWRVITSPLPDAAIIMNEGERAFADTLYAGEALKLNYTIRNLGNAAMEPILVRYTLVSANGKTRTFLKRTDALPADGEIRVNHVLSSDGFKGTYRLNIEVNTAQEQVEVSDCNNFGSDEFYVIPDDRNPLLEVLFDGYRITNGSRFTASPIIQVILRDPTSRALLDNPDDFVIKLHYPGGLTWRVNQDSKYASFEPAVNIDENKARFVLTPNLNFLGVYTLEVQAKDIAGNLAGKYNYKITFEMVDGGDDVLFDVFPNPSSDFVEFEYYLPDDREPTVFALSIYTADGKLLHKAFRSDFGGIERGVNRYRWNLIDDQGKSLPTGIYMYQLINDIDTLDKQKRGKILVLRK